MLDVSGYQFSYAVLKYRHDVAAGEVLNVGVVLYSPDTGQIGLLYDHRYARLSQAFANFDGDLYKKLFDRLNSALETIGRPLTEGLFQTDARSNVKDVATLIREVWPDQGLSYFAGSVAHGVTDELDRELNELFDRFVLSQFDRREAQARFDDEQLWDQFKRALSHRGIVQHLKPVTLGPAEVEFEHAYKNERWHVFEPLSLDYLSGADMKDRAYKIAGKAAAVRDLDEFGSFTILLGNPRRVESVHQFDSAIRILKSAPGSPRIVQESEADSFAAGLERDMRAHGVVPQ